MCGAQHKATDWLATRPHEIGLAARFKCPGINVTEALELSFHLEEEIRKEMASPPPIEDDEVEAAE